MLRRAIVGRSPNAAIAFSLSTFGADSRSVDSAEVTALTRLGNGRFQSFAEAAESVLDALEGIIPGTLMLGQFDPEEEVCHVIDVRGPRLDDLKRGSTLPPISEYLRSSAFESWLAIPLEMSDGRMVGTLCALSDRGGAYRSDHFALLTIAAHLLSYEWESVQVRTELRRLQERHRDDRSTDPETGLPSRDNFVSVLDREWRLVKRGTVQSVLIACHVEPGAPHNGASQAMASLAMKDAAAALAGNARVTDHLGRVGETQLATVLVGCQDTENAESFLRRFQAALTRTTRARPFPIAASFGIQNLSESDSPVDALELAESAARASSGGDSIEGAKAPQGVGR